MGRSGVNGLEFDKANSSGAALGSPLADGASFPNRASPASGPAAQQECRR